MKQIFNIVDIKNGNFYLEYSQDSTSAMRNGLPVKGKRFNIIECFNEKHKDIAGDIPTGVHRIEVRMLAKRIAVGMEYEDNLEVDHIDCEDKAFDLHAIYPEPNVHIFELNDDEVTNHVYFEVV